MADGAIEIRDLHVVRGDNVVLPGLSADVARGSVTGLLGPSGSGKSTLMRAIVGVQLVQAGSVHVLGEPAGAPSLRLRVAYVTQAPSVYADLSVRENLEYFARLLGAGRERVAAAVATVGLEREVERVVGGLSGGERARASLATALLATLLVSSHVMDEAERCDELVLLREGQILATGTPRELKDRTETDNLDDAFLTLVEAQT